MRQRIRLGLELPPLSTIAGVDRRPAGDLISVEEVGRLAEESGLGTLWLVEGGLDPVPMLGSLARTSNLGLGLMVRPSHGRHPTVLARDVTTLDLLTTGRAAVALIEHDAEPVDVDRLGEATSILRLLLTEGQVTVAGRFYEVAELTTRPRPTSPQGPPVVAGVIAPPKSQGPSPESVVIEASADAYITGGSAAEVVACRRRLDGAAPAGLRPMLLWRGAVGPGDQGIARVASMLESGADGLVAVLDQDAALGGRLHRAEVAQALDAVGSHAARLGL